MLTLAEKHCKDLELLDKILILKKQNNLCSQSEVLNSPVLEKQDNNYSNKKTVL
jgi:hypothetical protein